jgi:ssDNA-binding Zn-finger/Zn-ribbon topoisomerase 1
MSKVDTRATLTCPECNSRQDAIMPSEQKQHFYKCSNEKCEANISSSEDECCIFCSYSNKKCPIKQINPKEEKKSKLQSLI